MRLRTILTIALVLATALVFAQTKKKDKKTMPAIFGTARYVYVQAEEGDIYRPGLLPEDRQAISDVMDALRDWNRYILTPNPDGAELIFYVRKGRIASGTLGGSVGAGTGPAGSQRPSQRGAMAGGEVGRPDDFVEVKMRDDQGQISAPIWQRSLPDGLDPPHVLLIKSLRDAVERDYPQ